MRKLVQFPRRLQEVGQTSPDVARGRLAESYDGIGQYVLVALASSSVGAAYKARIAAGDFGGGRIFPQGTPVLVVSNHGLLEVISLGNLPGDFYLDTFDNRELDNCEEWGESSLGSFVWQISSEGSGGCVSVADGLGVMLAPTAQDSGNTINAELPQDISDLLFGQHSAWRVKVPFTISESNTNANLVISADWFTARVMVDSGLSVFYDPSGIETTQSGSFNLVATHHYLLELHYIKGESIEITITDETTGEYNTLIVLLDDRSAVDSGFSIGTWGDTTGYIYLDYIWVSYR